MTKFEINPNDPIWLQPVPRDRMNIAPLYKIGAIVTSAAVAAAAIFLTVNEDQRRENAFAQCVAQATGIRPSLITVKGRDIRFGQDVTVSPDQNYARSKDQSIDLADKQSFEPSRTSSTAVFAARVRKQVKAHSC